MTLLSIISLAADGGMNDINRECDMSRVRNGGCGPAAQPSAELRFLQFPHGRLQRSCAPKAFYAVFANPLGRSCKSMARNAGNFFFPRSWPNPLRRSCASTTQNADKVAVLAALKVACAHG